MQKPTDLLSGNYAATLPKNIWGNIPLSGTAYFRKIFSLNTLAKRAILRIFVDTGYELYLNERFVAVGDEWNNTRDYDVTPLLVDGLNIIAVKGLNHGGHRGLALELRIFPPDGEPRSIVSDSDWLASGEECWGWKSATYDDSQWQNARILDLSQAGDEQWWDRPGDNAANVIPCQGRSLFFQGEIPKGTSSPFFQRKKQEQQAPSSVIEIVGPEYEDNFREFPADVAFSTCVIEASPGNGSLENVEGLLKPGLHGLQVNACAPGGGPAVTVDFGGETIGYLRLKVSSEGPVSFKLIFGEVLSDCHHLPPVESLLHKMLVEEIRLDPGIHEWESRSRQGFRFVRMEFLNCPSPVQVEGVSVKTSVYPSAYLGYFSCSDPLLNEIWTAGRKTLHLCMQEYYLDGIKRDRFLWVADARLEALINYYAFGDQELFRYCWKELAAVQYRQGGIPSVLGEGASMLWDYVAWWIIAFGDYYWHTGDLDFPRSLKEHLIRAIDWLVGKSGEDGLIDVPENRTESWMCVLNKKSGKDLALNQLYYRSLQVTAELMGALGESARFERYNELADKTKKAFNDLPSSPGVDQFVPAYDHPPSGSIDCFEILEAHFRNRQPEEALRFIREHWGGMLGSGTDTFWEAPIKMPTLKVDEIGSRFDPTSRCHGWTAGPTHALLSGVAGIKPISPGFKTFEIKPQMGGLTSVKGVVPTPLGPIAVSIHYDQGGCFAKVLVPKGSRATFHMPGDNPCAILERGDDDTNKIQLIRHEAGRSVFDLPSGEYHFRSQTND